MNSAFEASAFCKCVAEPEKQMLLFVRESVPDLDLRKQRRWIEILDWTRLFMGMRLLQIYTLCRAIQRYLALFVSAGSAISLTRPRFFYDRPDGGELSLQRPASAGAIARLGLTIGRP